MKINSIVQIKLAGQDEIEKSDRDDVYLQCSGPNSVSVMTPLEIGIGPLQDDSLPLETCGRQRNSGGFSLRGLEFAVMLSLRQRSLGSAFRRESNVLLQHQRFPAWLEVGPALRRNK